MSRMMEVLSCDNDLIREIYRSYVLANPKRFPMYHMGSYDFYIWIGKLRTYLPKDLEFSELMSSVGFDIDGAVVDTILKLEEAQRLRSNSNPEIQKSIREHFCMLDTTKALDMINLSPEKSMLELLVCYTDFHFDAEANRIVDNLQKIYEICAEKEYSHSDIIVKLKSLKTMHESNIHEHLYRIFIMHEEYRPYFVHHEIIVPEDIPKMHFLTPEIIDLFGEFHSIAVVITLYRQTQKQVDADEKLQRAFSTHIDLEFEREIHKVENLYNSSPGSAISPGIALVMKIIRIFIKKRMSDKIDDIVLYIIKTRAYIEIDTMDSFLIRTFVRYQLHQTIEYLAEINALNFRNEKAKSTTLTVSLDYEYSYSYSDWSE
jgi:hypothetical protein